MVYVRRTLVGIMASAATWTLAATMMLTGLAGCVAPIPADEPRLDCEGWSRYWCAEGPHCTDDCCEACWDPPHPAPPIHGEPLECPAWNASEEHPLSASCWAPPPPPPLLDLFERRMLAPECHACGEVALASDGARLFVASGDTLAVVEGEETRILTLPSVLRAPHVAAARDGRAWIAGVRDGPLGPEVLLVFHDGRSGPLEVATLRATEAPPALLAQRAFVAPLGAGALLVLDTGDAAWGVRYTDGAFGAPERITPLGAKALVGAPGLDARGRVLVPYALAQHDAPRGALALLAAGVSPTMLYYGALASAEAAWSTHGGFAVPVDLASAPAIEPGASGAAALLWVDGAGALQRVESWDGGGSWGSPEVWSDLARRTLGEPGAHRLGGRATVAWWEELPGGASLVVARTDGSSRPMARADAAHVPVALPGAPLALLHDGRAVVAWAQEGELWVSVEGGSLPAVGATGCDDNAHCVARV